MFSLQPVRITVWHGPYGKIQPAVFLVRIVKENAFRVCNKEKDNMTRKNKLRIENRNKISIMHNTNRSFGKLFILKNNF